MSEPWWNDSEKVAGLLSTLVCLTVVIVVCVLAIGLTLKVVS